MSRFQLDRHANKPHISRSTARAVDAITVTRLVGCSTSFELRQANAHNTATPQLVRCR